MPHPPDPVLRPAIPADFLVLAAWVPDAAACRHWAGPKVPFPFAAEDLEALLAGEGRTSHALAEGTDLVAFGQHWVLAPGRVHLGRILVAPAARGRGFGRLLCRQLMPAAVQATGAQAVTLRVYRDNAVALALYASLGFRPVAAESTEEALFMEAAALPSARQPDRVKLR